MDTSNRRAGLEIEARRLELARTIVEHQYSAQPELVARYGDVGRAKCLEDTLHHLASIAAALSLATPGIFVDYVAWVKGVLEARNIPSRDLARNFVCIREVLLTDLPAPIGSLAAEYIDAGLQQLWGTEQQET